MKAQSFLLVVALNVWLSACSVSNTGELYYLNAYQDEVWVMATDGTNARMISDDAQTPDGIAVDVEKQLVYWSNMGNILGNRNNGSISCFDLNTDNQHTLIPVGDTFTPKQIVLEKQQPNNFIYWSDREGQKVYRAEISDCQLITMEVLVDYTDFPVTYQPVGIAVDGDYFYWTVKDEGTVNRAALNQRFPTNQWQELYSGVAEPIDLQLDAASNSIYLTTRGDNRVYRGDLDGSGELEEVGTGITELIGLDLDLKNNDIYYSDVGGSIYRLNLDTGRRVILQRGLPIISPLAKTGVAFVGG